MYDVSMEDLLDWNPSFDPSNCTMQPGFSYCVYSEDQHHKPNYTAILSGSSACWSAEEIGRNNIPQGTTSTCNCYSELQGDVEPEYRSNCDEGLYLGLGSNDTRGVCIRVSREQSSLSTSRTSRISSLAPSLSTSSTSTKTAIATKTSLATHGPTQTGIAADCQKFKTIDDGDTCSDVLKTYGISMEQFYAWNPSVGPDRVGMWLHYAYCVSAPSRISTSTNASPTTGPLRDGSPKTCSKYYTPQAGETCQHVLDVNGLELAQLYKWNTDIGRGCESMWPGYGLCVSGGPA
ncbi:carbohydrate-binding module family 50 protein [Karstenula rhodostoma CBS 690.94]|uniref:Carbohydrate-binding module family 50 protein n=1 Tax=Karstenula rhodostoma CBS 690.94 TaxID=1392251 RepID=A0A9P4PAF5_9PLEO|nr:carbohydrate-binding module family 50 protein [Karstenula rhodostoma CBS 690.94]